MSDWNLSEELLSLTHSISVSEALRTLGILQPNADVAAVTTVQDWHQSGAESFLYTFDVHSSDGAVTRLVFKAYAPFFSAIDLSSKVGDLLERRRLLGSYGISVPRLYAVKDAVVLEEFIPFSLPEWFADSPRSQREKMTVELRRLADVLDRLGFAPVDPYSDLRTDGSNLYVTDFGEDLGPPFLRVDLGYNRTKLLKWLSTLHAAC
jgi:hypothetical protein